MPIMRKMNLDVYFWSYLRDSVPFSLYLFKSALDDCTAEETNFLSFS